MRKNQHGFTLIEMLVAITLVGILITITTEMLVRVLRVANRARVQSEIKSNAESAISQIERIVRNAYKLEGGLALVTYDFPRTAATPTPITSDWSCDNNSSAVCELIIQNPTDALNKYTRISFYRGGNSNPDAFCPIELFGSEFIKSPSNRTCNGTIRISSTTSTSVDNVFMESESIITNFNLRSGVNMSAFSLKAYAPANNPPIIEIKFTLAQPVAIRNTNNPYETESNAYTTVLSLRNY